MTAPRLALNPRLFGVVAAFRADGGLRYYLATVQARKHPHLPGALICATDGHQLALAYDASAEVERDVLLQVDPRTARACLARSASRMELRDGRLCVDWEPRGRGLCEAWVQPGRALAPDEWQAQFPQYDTLLPDGPDDLQPWSCAPLAPRLVARLAWAAQNVVESGVARYASALLNYSRRSGAGAFSPGSDPVVTRFAGQANLLALTMPMRTDEPAFPLFVAGLAREGRRKADAKLRAGYEVRRLLAQAQESVNADAEPVPA